MNYRFLYLIFSTSIASIVAYAQPELQKIVPLSPNAAAIAKYGEIPVGYYTGVPNIGVPIYDIKSKSLSLPLSLNYHAGGNKVEDIASWVGLGWSFSNIPSISRRVNGIPDEAPGGFFSTYNGETVKELSERLVFGTNQAFNYQAAIFEGQTDTEADIFSFSLNGRSGKFFWDQKTTRFLVTPWSNIKIEYTEGLFKITDENGTIYWFTVIENSAAAGSSGAATSTTWWISKIYDVNKTDSLLFNYSYEIQSITTLNPRSKLLMGQDCSPPQSVSTINSTGSYSVSRIDFSNGYVQFNKEATARQDLSGGHALQNVQVYDADGSLIKRLNFSYSYRGSGAIENKRMMLDYVDEIAIGTTEHHKHSFVYESQIDAPSRLSAAQDYWGFYNGAISNTDLIPTANVTFPPNFVTIPGADREVNPSFSQFAVLNRIYYPTGGYSDFEYENNTAYGKGLPKKYKGEGAVLQADEANPPSNSYSTTFEINNPEDQFLNGGLGGANVKIQVGGMACIGCSLLTLHGLDAANNNINTTISYNLNYHLPNGHYEMTANFGTQSPDDFKDFHYIITWNVIDNSPNVNLNQYVGGLRIKAIRADDGSGNRILKFYRYTNTFLSDTSSGDIFSNPYFVRSQDYTCIDYLEGGYSERYSYKIMVNPNITQVTHSGSFIGYSAVYEKVDSLGMLGYNEYKFTNRRDIVAEASPFPPPVSLENLRGQPLEQNTYRKDGDHYSPVKRDLFEYKDVYVDNHPSFNLKTRAIKDPVYNSGIMVQPPQFDVMSYDLIPNWSAVSKKTEKVYDVVDTTRYATTITDYTYGITNFYIARMDEGTSDGKTKKTYMYYAGDTDPDNSSGVLGIPQMWNASNNNYLHLLDPVIKTKVYVDNTLVRQEDNIYSYNVTNKWILKTRSEVLPTGKQLGKLGYNFSYEGHAQLMNILQDSNIPKSFLWGYNSSYPIANINNAFPSNVFHTSFEDSEGNSGTDDSKTGRKSKINGYSKTLTGLANGDYIFSYWQKSNGVWSFNSSIVSVSSGSFTISLPGQVDEIRFYPKGSQMITYTYDPLIGMISQTDERDRTTYFDFDNFSRLKNVRDNERNIVKRYEYGYAEQNNFTAASLNATLDGFRQVDPGRMKIFFAQDYENNRDNYIRDTRLIFRNGVAQLPDQYRTLPFIPGSSFYTALNLQLADPYSNQPNLEEFCFMENGYSIEWRVRMPKNSFNNNKILLGSYFNFMAVFTRLEGGTYLSGYQDFDGHLYGHEFGDQDFTYIRVGEENDFDQFQTIRLKVTKTRYYVYYNNVLIKDYPRNNDLNGNEIPIDKHFYVDAGFLGHDGAVDYVKVFDNAGVVKFAEDFDNPSRPAKPASSLICPALQPDCQTAFKDYFNQTYATNYTYAQIAALYLEKTGQTLDVCP